MGTWRRLLTFLTTLSVIGLIVGALKGTVVALAVVCALLVLLVLAYVRDVSALQQWLKDPLPETAPNVSRAWDVAFSQLARLVRTQRRSSSELKVTLDRFQLAAAAIPDGVCMLDGHGRIEWCNPSAEVHLGLDASRDVGSHITNLVRNPAFVAFLSDPERPVALRLNAKRNGRELVLSLQIVPYGEEQKLLMSRDITRFEEVETIRRDFVANVSHELRTPITVVAGFLETIADMPNPPADLLERSVRLMRDQTVRMQRLVEDLLTLSRLESEQNPLREEPVNVGELALKLKADARSLSEGKHSVQLALESAAWLLASEDELRSAFGNLVTNAVRYTPQGGTITIGWAERGEGAVFSVRDTGIGIEPQHIPRLTERFYRVDRSRSRATGGTGLGLAIVKHVLHRHQARLEVTSEPGKGSTFSVVFPHARILALPPEPVESESEIAEKSGGVAAA